MTDYNIPPEEVTESLWCLICMERLSSDEEVCVDHMVEVHGAQDGTMIREMTRISVSDMIGVTVQDLVKYPLITEKAIQPKW